MINREFGVLARYDFQSSIVALERLERDTESRLLEEWDGGLDSGVEEMVGGASDFAVFLGAIVSDRSCQRSENRASYESFGRVNYLLSSYLLVVQHFARQGAVLFSVTNAAP